MKLLLRLTLEPRGRPTAPMPEAAREAEGGRATQALATAAGLAASSLVSRSICL